MVNNKLIQDLHRLIESNRASSYFINGPPGAGKSYLLKSLVSSLPTIIQQCFVLGPYEISTGRSDELPKWILTDCSDAGFLESDLPDVDNWDLTKAWKLISDNSLSLTRQTFIVLIDIGNISIEIQPEIFTLFSGIRKFEGLWDSRNIRILLIIAGSWDHPDCIDYFRNIIETSLPYTIGHNYKIWSGIPKTEFDDLVKSCYSDDKRVPFSQILYEITGGHPGAAIDILGQIDGKDLSVPSLLKAADLAALNGSNGRILIELWEKLPGDSKTSLKEMVFHRRIQATTLPAHLERLRIAGIATQKLVGEQYYLDFHSWYVELLVGYHVKDLGIASDNLNKIEFGDLIPPSLSLSSEAFRLINEIENLTRNYVTIQLSSRADSGFHYLMGKAKKYNHKTEVEEDAYQRAEEWQNRSSEWGMPRDLNPLIAYLSTRDLANLIEELVADSGISEWTRIAQAIRSLSDVRDAIMHNQFIDDEAFERLFDLKAQIYEELSNLQWGKTN